MPSRKRSLAEASAPTPPPARKEPSLVERIRNMWQFANLCQWIFIFGRNAKIDDNVDVEMLETECLKPGAPGLKDIGLRLLQFLSSHRGLNLSMFDEYTRRQYLSKAPALNPFGDGEVPASFSDFDVFQKIKILQQLTVFAMIYSDKLREKTEEPDQTQWRIESYGWDSDDRTYFLLDDNRLYRQTDPPPPPPPPVKPSKKTKAGRASLRKRRRTTNGSVGAGGDENGDDTVFPDAAEREPEDNGIGGCKWECVVVTLDQLNVFLESLRKSDDDNEKIMRQRLEEHLLPILEKQEASRRRKQQARERELLSMAKMANAKRSSRLAGKAEQQRIEQEAREEEARRQAQEAAARKKEAAALREQHKIMMDREHRLQSRHERLQERETRRARHEDELAKLSESERGSSAGRLSQRRLMTEMEKNKKALEKLEGLEDDWIFDCACGVYGQVDDGTHSISCERCNTWQHSACLSISQEAADAPDFHYVCQMCQRREADDAAGKPRTTTTIKLKLHNGAGNGAGNPSISLPSAAVITSSPPQQSSMVVELPAAPAAEPAELDEHGPESVSQPSLETLGKKATFPPPAKDQPDGAPVIPVKKPGRPSLGISLPHPILTDITGSTSLQTPAPAAAASTNPLSSSPPIKLTPVPTSSPYLGPAKTNGSYTPVVPASTATPRSTKGGSFDGGHRGFPPSTPLGGSSPTGSFSFSMAPLPPSEHGISPVKHSSPPPPPPRPRSSTGGARGISVNVNGNGNGNINGGSSNNEDGSASPANHRKLTTQSPIVPPTTMLVPSPPPQINTPPHKHSNPGPVRP